MYVGTLRKVKSDDISLFCESIVDTFAHTGDESYLYYLIENVKAAPIIMSATKKRDFEGGSLLKYPSNLSRTDNLHLRYLVNPSNMGFLATGNKFHDKGANQLVKFKYNGKNYIGYTGNINKLLDNHTNANEIDHYRTDDKGRSQVGFVGYTYEGDTPPKVTKQALANIYVNQVKGVFDFSSPLSDEEHHTKFSNMIEYDTTKDSPVKDLGDVTDKFDPDVLRVKGSLNYDKRKAEHDKSNNQKETEEFYKTNPKKMAEDIYKEHHNDKNFIAKKITALRGLINRYKFKMNQTHDNRIKTICKKVINKIIEVIDHLLRFIHKGVNRF